MNLGQTSTSLEILKAPNGQQFEIYQYNFVFQPWEPEHTFDTYGGKQILQLDTEPLFAELMILRLLERLGYKGVWVDTYGNKFWQRLPHFSFPVKPDKKIIDIYNKIYEIKGGRRAGCFDVMAYSNEDFVFAELKRNKKDKIRQSQIEWLQAAVKADIKNAKFIICEWTTSATNLS